ncbi:MAG TPA: hypothetical protein VLT45_27865 [Kofleriaceae bacterium]|nr:hypothetical protein [Kofleriaceae bacterium]
MRTTAIFVIALAAGCAGDAPSTVDYARLAPIIGRSIATPDAGGEVGALADALMIARGGLPVGFETSGAIITGTHDGARYTYAVFCEDAAGASITCSPQTFRAYAFVQWDSPALHRSGMWQLEHLQSATATATGTSALDHEADGFTITDVRHESIDVDLGTYVPTNGSIEANLRITTDGDPVNVVGSITFPGRRMAIVLLGDSAYTIDLTSGATAPVIVE